jgi:hypothetical protein
VLAGLGDSREVIAKQALGSLGQFPQMLLRHRHGHRGHPRHDKEVVPEAQIEA